MYILITICIMIVLFVIGVIIYDTNRFVVREYKLSSGKIKESHKFVILSDLHCKEYGEKNEKLLQKIREINPDHILIAGDMITAVPEKDLNPGMDFVEVLSKEYPISYSFGNHEYRLGLYPETYGDMWDVFWNRMKETSVTFLRNEKADLHDNIAVYGLEIDREYYKRFKKLELEDKYVEKLLGKPDTEKFTILLAHNPDYFENYAEWGADLVCAGHVHGGIANLPILGGVISPIFRLFPKYDGGEFKKDGSTMILSRGLGTHTIHIRFLNPAELIVLDIMPEEV